MSRWFESQRIAWIAEMLLIYGFINREHLVRKFGISVPQASKDLQTFARNSSGAMVYDLSKKCYVRPSHRAGKAGR
jgi:DeoR/GlpR family transcriptional regulator of sugar metabolism